VDRVATLTPGTGRAAATAPAAAARAAGRRGESPAERTKRLTALPATTPRVRVPELLTGVVVVVGCALGAVLWHTSSTSTRQALVLSHPVERGHVFVEDDFAAASVSAEGMRLVAFAERDRMLGRIAVADLDSATPITDSVATPTTPLAPGEARVGRRLDAGEYPADLASEARVQVVLVVEQAPVTGGAPTKQSVVLDQVAVVDAVTPLANAADSAIVTLRLPSALAQQVASADGVRLVQVGG